MNLKLYGLLECALCPDVWFFCLCYSDRLWNILPKSHWQALSAVWGVAKPQRFCDFHVWGGYLLPNTPLLWFRQHNVLNEPAWSVLHLCCLCASTAVCCLALLERQKAVSFESSTQIQGVTISRCVTKTLLLSYMSRRSAAFVTLDYGWCNTVKCGTAENLDVCTLFLAHFSASCSSPCNAD